jgi:hypothetical protein
MVLVHPDSVISSTQTGHHAGYRAMDLSVNLSEVCDPGSLRHIVAMARVAMATALPLMTGAQGRFGRPSQGS